MLARRALVGARSVIGYSLIGTALAVVVGFGVLAATTGLAEARVNIVRPALAVIAAVVLYDSWRARKRLRESGRPWPTDDGSS